MSHTLALQLALVLIKRLLLALSLPPSPRRIHESKLVQTDLAALDTAGTHERGKALRIFLPVYDGEAEGSENYVSVQCPGRSSNGEEFSKPIILSHELKKQKAQLYRPSKSAQTNNEGQERGKGEAKHFERETIAIPTVDDAGACLLQEFGDAVGVWIVTLSQALVFLYSVGWVHHDVSACNVLRSGKIGKTDVRFKQRSLDEKSTYRFDVARRLRIRMFCAFEVTRKPFGYEHECPFRFNTLRKSLSGALQRYAVEFMHQGILQLALKARRKCHRPTQIHLNNSTLSFPINLHPLLPAVGSSVFLAPALNDSWKTPRAKTETRSHPRFGAVAVYYSFLKSWDLKYKSKRLLNKGKWEQSVHANSSVSVFHFHTTVDFSRMLMRTNVNVDGRSSRALTWFLVLAELRSA
ncbi:hypothetical protein EDD15DRAFT_2202477 [Pisolithus albus]|nr:hypothetical protein EDD15DRAFT_2202477 [Pisolithus albus]